MEGNEKVYEFSFNNQLPRIYELVNAVISVEPGAVEHRTGRPESYGRKACVQSCSKKLKRLWEQAFGVNFIKTEKAIKAQVRKELDNYSKFMKSRGCKNKTKREKLKLWRQQNTKLFYCFTPTFKPKVFDKLEMFENEKLFYHDQLGSRTMFISEEVDEEYEAARAEKIAKYLEARESYEAEMSYIFNENNDADGTSAAEPSPSISLAESSSSVLAAGSSASASSAGTSLSPNKSTTRSGFIRVPTRSIGLQTDIFYVSQPPVRKVKVCSEDIKGALSEMSVAAKISPDQARVAAQAYSKNWYKHTYYLSFQEKYPDQSPKKTRTADDYAAYSDIFPDKKTISNHKHSQALQREFDAASALKNKKSDEKVILHFDTTSRSRIEGEWPALILNILAPPNQSTKFTLRPLFFAFEDRLNISRLIVETLHRLAVTIESTPCTLWELIDGFMTDSVTKNLQVEHLVAETFGSKHIPHHYLCSSHTSEKFDSALLSVLATIEKEISLREKLEASNPQLRSFYRGKKCIVECALVALCKLITPDSSAKSSSLSDEFDVLVEKEGMVKLVSSYQERKFTKLGTTAACVVKSLDLYIQLLERTPKKNLLVKACRLYVSCEFIVCALKCLAFFTFKIGMPFLNMCELSSQKDMKKLLPRFYHDLADGNVNCLDDFHVEWNRIKIDEPKSALAKYIISKMCVASAEGLRIQRGREYGFFGEEFTPRATNVSELPDDEVKLIPSHNLDCERNLSVAGVYMEQSSRCSNRFFKSRCTRDNVTLHKTSQIARISRELKSALDQREQSWYEKQKKIQEEHIETLIEKGKNRDDYIDKVLAKCKSWGGPFLSIDEMSATLRGKSDDEQRKILRHEITFQKSAHPNDALVRKELYLINKQEVASMLYNLGILLSNECMREENNGEVFLPTEADVLAVISSKPPDELDVAGTDASADTSNVIAINELCAVVWDFRGRLNWYLGYVIEASNTDIKVEHLERLASSINSSWRYSKYRDVQDVDYEQVLPINVSSEWDYSDPEHFVLVVKNSEEILSCFQKYVQE